MDRTEIEAVFETILERLAAVEHARWADWQRYMHSVATRQADGSLVLPAGRVRSWERQIAMPYSELSERERESDRREVRRYLPIIAAALGAGGERSA